MSQNNKKEAMSVKTFIIIMIILVVVFIITISIIMSYYQKKYDELEDLYTYTPAEFDIGNITDLPEVQKDIVSYEDLLEMQNYIQE